MSRVEVQNADERTDSRKVQYFGSKVQPTETLVTGGFGIQGL